MSSPVVQNKSQNSGLFFAVAAFGFWGLVQPYFFGVYGDVNPLVVVAHRTFWSCGFIWLWLLMRGKISGGWTLLQDRKMAALLALTGMLIFTNWGIYIYAVQAQRLLDASVGYFMTPLMTAGFGMIFLGERPRRLQLVALILAAGGVLIYTLWLGRLPLIALALSLTFSAYGGIRKKFAVPAERGMAVETLLLAPLALGFILAFGWSGGPYFIAPNGGQALWLASAGLVTLLPLVWYNAAAARMPLISLGLLQFIVPVGLFILSLLPPLNETLDLQRGTLFIFVWAALVFYVIDLIRSSRVR